MPVTIVDPRERDESARWDELGAQEFYSSGPWTRFVAQDPSAHPFTAVAWDENRPLVGLPVSEVLDEANDFYRWDELVSSRCDGARLGPRLLLGPRRGYRSRLLVHPDADEDRADAAVAELVAALSSLADDRGLGGMVALYADTRTALGLSRACPGATVLHIADDATVDLPGSGIDDYLAARPGHRRRRIRRELAAIDALGLSFGHHRLADVADAAAVLLASTQERHGHGADVAALTRSLAAQGAALGDSAEVLTIEDGDSILGFVSYYRHGSTLYLRATGIDHEALPGPAPYLALCYYEPFRIAYRHGQRHVHAGIEAGETKALRGARLRPSWLVDLAPEPAVDPRAVAEHNASALDERLASPVLSPAICRDDWAPFT